MSAGQGERRHGRPMRVAVMCAYNPGNTGMYTVDLAARALFGRDLARHRLRWTLACAHHPGRPERSRLGTLRYAILREAEDLAAFDRVVYWGDFQTNSTYGATEFANREIAFGYAPDRETGFANWRRINLLDGVGGPPARAISASNNFQTLAEDGGPDAARIDQALAETFRAIYPRDPYSVERLARVHPGAARGAVALGVDAAFLLGTGLPGLIPRRAPLLTWYFRRMKLADPERAAAAVAHRTGLRAIRLGTWNRLGDRAAPLRAVRMRAKLRASRLVLTDVYHVAINAMALGTPVLLLARAASEQHGTLGEYKKHTLLGMFGLTDWLHVLGEGEPDRSALEALGAHAARILAEDDPHERLAPMRAATAAYRTRLKEAILSETAGPV